MHETEKMNDLNKAINNIENPHEQNLGLLLWKLESLEDFYPCYKTMIKQDK